MLLFFWLKDWFTVMVRLGLKVEAAVPSLPPVLGFISET